jgi:hypothetical protein
MKVLVPSPKSLRHQPIANAWPLLCVYGLLFSCGKPTCTIDAGSFFGSPVAQTGLTKEQCNATCASCDSRVTGAQFSAEKIEHLKSFILDNPSAEIAKNPYTGAVSIGVGVCGVILNAETKHYTLESFAAASELKKNPKAILTHHDACGSCSSLQDLAVYASNLDLGKPVTQCGSASFGKSFEFNVDCLLKLGFTKPCAQIWAWNTLHTREKCLDKCILSLDEPYHLPNGNLNPCLQCDETESGLVFKGVAGRTRRNTGIASSICRPCSEAKPVAHEY